MTDERRRKRSCNTQQALDLQLAATVERGGFSSVMLTERQGIPLAAAGNVSADEEICVLAPRLVPGNRLWQGRVAIDNGPERLVTIAPIKTDVGHLYLCGVGGVSSAVMAELLHGSRGVHRILA